MTISITPTKDQTTIIIDPEFKALIPQLSTEEYELLEASIQTEGCRDALVLWGDILIDGHNRYAICQKHGIEFQTTQKTFDCREAVIVWMIETQLGRRNVADAVRIILAIQLEPAEAALAKERQRLAALLTNIELGRSVDEALPPISAEASVNGETRTKLANKARVGKAKFDQGKYILKHAPDMILKLWRDETLSTNRAYKVTQALQDTTPEVTEIVFKGCVDDPDTISELKRLQIEAPDTFETIQLSGFIYSSQSSAHVNDGYKAIKAVLKDLAKDHAAIATQERKQNSIDKALLPDAKYRVIYADPPWKYDNTMPDYFTEQADHYDLMTVDEIRDMPITTLVEDNAVLFLWVTSPILEQSFEVIRAWGFKYKASFVWDKVKHNMGHYNSVRHEFLLVCVRGSCQPDVLKLFDSVVTVERSDKHSEKPEDFRQIIDTIYPYGKRIELFARVHAEGWEAYGNEIINTVVPECQIANVA